MAENRPEWCVTDLAVLTAGGHHGSRLPDAHVRTGPLSSERLRRETGRRLESRRSRRRSRPFVRRLSGFVTTIVMDADGQPWPDGGRHARRGRRARSPTRSSPSAAEARHFEERAASISTRRCGDHHLHVGDERRSEGRHADARQPAVQRRGGGQSTGRDQRRCRAVVPATQSRVRADGALHVSLRRRHRRVRRIAGDARAGHGQGTPDAHDRGAARLRETVRPHSRDESRRRLRSVRRSSAGRCGVGRRRSAAVRNGQPVGSLLALQDRLADSLVFHDIRAATGGRLRVLVSGSAPLPRTIAEFFDAVGLTIIEGYGLTEASPVLTVNPLDRPKFGTVGRATSGRRVADRRGRRDPRARSEHHVAATTAGPKRREPSSSRMAGFTRGTSEPSTETATLTITDRKEGSDRHVGRKERRTAAD